MVHCLLTHSSLLYICTLFSACKIGKWKWKMFIITDIKKTCLLNDQIAFTQAFSFIKMMRWSESHYYRPRVRNSRVTLSCIPQFGVQIVCTRKINVDLGQFVCLVHFSYVGSIACWLFGFYSLWFAFSLDFCLLSDYISAFQWNCKFSHTNYFPSTILLV